MRLEKRLSHDPVQDTTTTERKDYDVAIIGKFKDSLMVIRNLIEKFWTKMLIGVARYPAKFTKEYRSLWHINYLLIKQLRDNS